MSAEKDVWFKYPDKKPTKEGEYLVINDAGGMRKKM